MIRVRDQRGELNLLLIPIILLALLFIGALSFAVWAYNGRQDFKNNVDSKVSTAVDAGKIAQQTVDAKTYAEAAKQPLKNYSGPTAYGSIKLSYPKTWSAYVDTFSSGVPVNGYFYPDTVPSISDPASTYALRVQVVTTSYDQIISQFNGALQQKAVTIAPYSLPGVPDVVGSRIDGQIAQKKQGTMIILPLRDKTLKIWTESSNFAGDFSTYILPNFTFSP